jgi:hypothetical protein
MYVLTTLIITEFIDDMPTPSVQQMMGDSMNSISMCSTTFKLIAKIDAYARWEHDDVMAKASMDGRLDRFEHTMMEKLDALRHGVSTSVSGWNWKRGLVAAAVGTAFAAAAAYAIKTGLQRS